MKGICATCKTAVEVEQHEMVRASNEAPGRKSNDNFTDLNYAACPKCGARVYLVPGPIPLEMYESRIED